MVLVLLVVAPLGALAVLGQRVVRDERDARARRMDQLLTARLDDADARVQQVLGHRRQQLRPALAECGTDPGALRDLPRQLPFVQQGFVLAADGALVYPSPDDPLTPGERDFLARTRALWAGADRLSVPAEGTPEASAETPLLDMDEGIDDGWYAWFWDSGLQLIYWRRDPGGAVVGAELGRARLMADIVAAMPVTDPDDPAMEHDRIALLDARGAALYQWGRHDPGPGAEPRIQRPLGSPLGAWSLSYHVSDAVDAAGDGAAAGWIAGLAALGLAVAGLGLWFHRASAREMREASQRVSFVNQVSHELKTPLTNIRMYAELLDRRLDDDDRARRHLDIIVSESQRLSRLIGNVLAFARQRRGALVLRPSAAPLDDVVSEALAPFRAGLQERGVEVRLRPGAPVPVRLDRDVVTQVVANLVGNVEKYAAGGGLLEVATAQDDRRCAVTVRDRGPGIPAGKAEQVFQPFVRLDDGLTEGVAGAGIGLTLARELARLHGGDLTLLPGGGEGACFEFAFRPLPGGEEDEA